MTKRTITCTDNNDPQSTTHAESPGSHPNASFHDVALDLVFLNDHKIKVAYTRQETFHRVSKFLPLIKNSIDTMQETQNPDESWKRDKYFCSNAINGFIAAHNHATLITTPSIYAPDATVEISSHSKRAARGHPWGRYSTALVTLPGTLKGCTSKVRDVLLSDNPDWAMDVKRVVGCVTSYHIIGQDGDETQDERVSNPRAFRIKGMTADDCMSNHHSALMLRFSQAQIVRQCDRGVSISTLNTFQLAHRALEQALRTFDPSSGATVSELEQAATEVICGIRAITWPDFEAAESSVVVSALVASQALVEAYSNQGIGKKAMIPDSLKPGSQDMIFTSNWEVKEEREVVIRSPSLRGVLDDVGEDRTRKTFCDSVTDYSIFIPKERKVRSGETFSG